MEATIWSLVPAVVAIVLALLTKEVYISLLFGVLVGALFYTGFDVIGAVQTTLEVMADKVGGNLNIVIFLVLLGMLVVLVQKSGAAAAYGVWAADRIKNARQAEGLTALLGVLIFVDDYFNCLTVGTVMSPVTDRFKITRAKLAYIIDSTAAPICIIAPISSWAAAVSSSMPEGSTIDGFSLFLQTIPYNFYALGTLLMVFVLVALGFSFSRMREHELKYPDGGDSIVSIGDVAHNARGRIIDLVLPIVVLILACLFFMLYTGGLFEGAGVVGAFANCDSSLSLVLGGFFTLIVTAFLYLPRQVLSFDIFNECLADGFKAMVPAILILTFAWTLSGISGEGYLESGAFVAHAVETYNLPLGLVPALFFLVAVGLSFATGTSWGTFGILVPLVVTIFGDTVSPLMVLSVAAVLSGAVNGDHISPISDTTILSSAGAGVEHLTHVSTQIPYALVVSISSFVGFLLAGLFDNGLIGLMVTLGLVLGIIAILRARTPKNTCATQAGE